MIALLAVAGWAVPWPEHAVEHSYSNGIYAIVQPALTSFSNLTPFAWLDVLLVMAVAYWLAAAARDVATAAKLTSARNVSTSRSDTTINRRTSWLAATVPIVRRTVVIAGAAALAFLAIWGFNYRRVPLASRLAFDPGRASKVAVLALGRDTVSRANALFADAHASPPVPANVLDADLAAAFADTERALGTRWQPVPGRPKATILDWYFQRAGVTGMTDPFFLETLIARDLLPVERPHVIAHEWSHLAGITDEGEANFAGWLTCLRGRPAHQYSGWLFLYSEIAAAVAPADARALAAGLDPGPRADLQAIRQRVLRTVNPRVADAGWRVYDGYLKANRVEEGAASYAGVVRLAAGVEFTTNWTPVLRQN